MKKLLYYACAAVLAMFAVSPCFAADSPWNGTWKLNEAKSRMTGNTITLTVSPDGKIHFSNGGTIEYTFACDGKDYTTIADRSISCEKMTDTVSDTTTKINGTVYATSHREISADGKTMTVTTKGTQPDGTAFTNVFKYERLSGSKGFGGKWKNTSTAESAPDVAVISVSSDTMHVEYPGFKETIESKLDGTAATPSGPTVPPGFTISNKLENPHKLQFTTKLNGKPLVEGTRTLGADGKTFTEESWVSGKPAEKEKLIYEKQ
jgi:hypothetical protein